MAARAKKDVRENIEYWRPIMSGFVQLSKNDLDMMTPYQLRKLNAAIDYKIELEKNSTET